MALSIEGQVVHSLAELQGRTEKMCTCSSLSNYVKIPQISDWVGRSFLSQSLCLKAVVLWLASPQLCVALKIGNSESFAWTTKIEMEK
jgi:hypothetical protein